MNFAKSVVFAVLVVGLVGAGAAHGAEKGGLEKALAQFQGGEYSEALATLKKMKSQSDTVVRYWEGVCESKLQKFDSAGPRLEHVMAAKSAAKYPDAAYLAGQAFYATQEFRKALAAFKLSASRGYKPGVSLYYVGYIKSTLKDSDGAIATFNQVLTRPDASEESMKQQSAFQIGEVYFAIGKGMNGKPTERAYFLKTVRPAYVKVIDMASDTPTGTNAASRLRDIDARFPPIDEQVAATGASGEHVPYTTTSTNPRKTANGTVLSAHAYSLSISEDFKYDTNVINQADQTLTLVSYAGSPYAKTTFLGKYQYVLDNQFILQPEVGGDGTFYFRDTAAVYGSSNTDFTPALRARWDYYAFGHKQASTIAEFEYLWGTRDYTEQHTPFTYYQSSQNIIIGERAQFFDLGPSTIKGHYKFYQNEQSDLTGRAIGVSAEQDLKTVHDQMLILTAGYEYQKDHNEFWDQGNYSAGAVYVMPHVYWGLTASLSLNFTVVDTMNQFVVRGYEINTSPSATVTKYFGTNDMFSVNVNYAFTKNTSGAPAIYAYTKNVFGIGGNVTF